MGLPGSNREKIAKQLHDSLPNSELLKSRDIRIDQQDVDFTHDGKMRHVYRMLNYARNSKSEYVIIDMVCPLAEMREILNPDIIIWADDIKSCNIPEVNESFSAPKLYDLKFKSMPENAEDIIEKILSKRY
jgi:hypothetical protein